MLNRRLLLSLMLASIATACHAQPPTKLTNGRATTAVRALLGLDQVRVVLGTCKAALNAKPEGATACTFLVVSGSGTSESQADFRWSGREWTATPSESQKILPFPDPVLADVHSWSKIDDNAGPIG